MMERFKNFIRKHSRQIFHICLLIICTLFMTYTMPREKSTSLGFKEGTPWENEQLIAEFSFEVPKADADITTEQENAKKTAKPYFIFNPEVGKQAVKKLRSTLNNGWFMSLTSNSDNFTSQLQELYNYGIISDEDAGFIKNNNYSEALSINGNRAETKSTKEFIPLHDAIKAVSSNQALMQRLGASLPLDSIIKPNYFLDIKRTSNDIISRIEKIDSTLANIQKGQLIINPGELVNHKTAQIINAYINEMSKTENAQLNKNHTYIFFGQILFVIIVMLLLHAYLHIYQREVITNTYKYTFTIFAATAFPVILGIMISNGVGNVFLLPFAIVPLMLCLFINNHTAFMVHLTTILICSTMLVMKYEFLLLQLTAGCSVILCMKELESRLQMFRCALITFLTYMLVYLCYNLIETGNMSQVGSRMPFYLGISSLLTLIAYPMMIVFEKTFHFVSNVTLIELSNLNSKLLLKMSQEAPGTFQHSIQVSNLAAEGARAIGANSLLVRTGALYHDIGKTNNPIYFTENQNGGINPHSALSEIESAQIIIRHVTEGIEIAKHEGLPQSIQNFISTHHGLSKTGYFYISYKNAHPDEEIDETLFTYPGPMPTTSEQAILMMADCVEAASHSIKEYTEENICSMVDSIIDKQVDSKTYSKSPLTFKDIDTIKDVFKKRLMAIYHTRISYPKENQKS